MSKLEPSVMLRRQRAILSLIALLLMLPLVAAVQSSQTRRLPPEGERPILLLDQQGSRGVVFFDHTSHESTALKATSGEESASTCSSCHHARRSNGVPDLAACSSCHRHEGDSPNPVTDDGRSIGHRLAFHGTCIECHRATQGPTLCGGCHKMAGTVLEPGR